MKITVVCRDADSPEPLIYTVEVENECSIDEVTEAITTERRRDLGEGVKIEIEPLFAFAGDIPTIADWRVW